MDVRMDPTQSVLSTTQGCDLLHSHDLVPADKILALTDLADILFQIMTWKAMSNCQPIMNIIRAIMFTMEDKSVMPDMTNIVATVDEKVKE